MNSKSNSKYNSDPFPFANKPTYEASNKELKAFVDEDGIKWDPVEDYTYAKHVAHNAPQDEFLFRLVGDDLFFAMGGKATKQAIMKHEERLAFSLTQWNPSPVVKCFLWKHMSSRLKAQIRQDVREDFESIYGLSYGVEPVKISARSAAVLNDAVRSGMSTNNIVAAMDMNTGRAITYGELASNIRYVCKNCLYRESRMGNVQQKYGSYNWLDFGQQSMCSVCHGH